VRIAFDHRRGTGQSVLGEEGHSLEKPRGPRPQDPSSNGSTFQRRGGSFGPLDGAVSRCSRFVDAVPPIVAGGGAVARPSCCLSTLGADAVSGRSRPGRKARLREAVLKARAARTRKWFVGLAESRLSSRRGSAFREEAPSEVTSSSSRKMMGECRPEDSGFDAPPGCSVGLDPHRRAAARCASRRSSIGG